LGRVYPSNFYQFHSGDNLPVGNPGRIEEAARLVVGEAKKACDLVQAGEYPKVVALGGGLHHAKRNFGEGFCLYNDVAFCGVYLQQRYKLERILILDSDAHAGNGTVSYFYDNPHVLFIDIHQDPRTIYPGTGFVHQTGTGAGNGFTVNIPMPIQSGDKSYRLAYESIIEPIVAEFKPQIIVRNGGSDPHFSDGLTNLGLSLNGFRMIGEKTRKMAEACDGKVVDLIASGYNRQILPYAWLALIAGLAGVECQIDEIDTPNPEAPPDRMYYQAEKVVEEVRTTLKPFWNCFR